MHPTRQRTRPIRKRWLYLLLVMCLIAAGLLLRSPVATLPAWFVKYGGDALWALVVFLTVGWISRQSPTMAVASIALTIAIAIECSQLYHAPWIDHLRAIPIGRLVLGNTFNAPDMIAYAIGIGMGAWIEHMAQRTHTQSDRID